MRFVHCERVGSFIYAFSYHNSMINATDVQRLSEGEKNDKGSFFNTRMSYKYNISVLL